MWCALLPLPRPDSIVVMLSGETGRPLGRLFSGYAAWVLEIVSMISKCARTSASETLPSLSRFRDLIKDTLGSLLAYLTWSRR